MPKTKSDAIRALRGIIEAYNEALTVHIYDESNGEHPSAEDLAAVELARAAVEAFRDTVEALRDSLGAMGSMRHQIEQMRGMFDDVDGTIHDACEDHDKAEDKARAALLKVMP